MCLKLLKVNQLTNSTAKIIKIKMKTKTKIFLQSFNASIGLSGVQ
jgi:hypothetical protein